MTSTDLNTVKASEIYQHLRDAILNGRLAPGTYLREREVAEQFGVSRTPVREALRRLERDGQVRLTPHIGAQVQEVSLQDLFEILEMRRCLEPHAASVAATRMTAEIEARLASLRKTFGDALEQEATPGIIRRLIASDSNLHELILNVAGNRRITQAIMDLRLSIQRYRYFGIPHRFQRNAREHLDIIAALLHRDRRAAEAAMARHLDQFADDMRQLLIPRPGNMEPQLRRDGRKPVG